MFYSKNFTLFCFGSLPVMAGDYRYLLLRTASKVLFLVLILATAVVVWWLEQ